MATSFSDDTPEDDLLGLTAAHEIGHFLGLFHTSEGPAGFEDPLEDTEEHDRGQPHASPEPRRPRPAHRASRDGPTSASCGGPPVIFLIEPSAARARTSPSPRAIQPAACAASEAQLRATPASAETPAPASARRCCGAVRRIYRCSSFEKTPTRSSASSAWRLTLRRLPTDDPLWRTATASLPAKHAEHSAPATSTNRS